MVTRLRAVTWVLVGLGLAVVAGPGQARGGLEQLGELLDAELGLTEQAAVLERSMATVEREQAGAEHSAVILEHAGRESMRRLDAYRAGADVREKITRRRARALYKAARGGIARLALEDIGRDEPTSAQRLARGRALRWLVRHDLQELAAYQRAERGAREELLRVERQLQALSALTTVHDMQGELVATAQAATGPALLRATRARRAQLSSMPAEAGTYREQLAQLRASWDELRILKRGGGVPGKLVRPVRGRLVGRFGEYEDPLLKLPMVRNGVELAARSDQSVQAPADGRVVMVAELPGFETVVVIDHGSGELAMLGRLWKVSVGEGQQVEAGDTIAAVAPKAVDDGLGTTVYMELRHGEKPVDPAPRLR
jgi:murein DD-endopeptidase MepM/ murein hydrolase activator NlpD